MPSYAYYKKKIIPLEEARMGVMTHAFHYGTGIFEGIRGNWNCGKEQIYLFRLKEHYERMLEGCHALRINLPHSSSELCQITVEMVRECGFREDIYVRPVAYKSSEALGVRLHGLEDDFLVFAFPWGPYLDVETARCAVSSWRRPKETPQGKINGLYVNAALAKTEAIENGFDEAIMLTPDGYVAEGSGENIFLVREGKLITPATYDYILKGITRDSVMKLAKNELHVETVERHIERGELYSAEEVFLTGTAANITPVGEIDRRKIGDGGIGKLTKKLQQLYAEVIQGKKSQYMEWCTPVYQK
ncbi:MAG: branched-chain amino acid transaminase [Chloroflexi bacterium]|nr:branched-chain amino acid transaminase [Chloroflexota bacterium]